MAVHRQSPLTQEDHILLVRQKIHQALEELENVTHSRERSLVATKLDEARLWAQEMGRKACPESSG